MTIYKSKISFSLVTFLVLVLGGVSLVMVEKSWPGLLILLPVEAFMIYIFRNTFYTVAENTLHIKCGLLFDESIEVQKIRKIPDSGSFLSAPALSFDRLEFSMINSIWCLSLRKIKPVLSSS